MRCSDTPSPPKSVVFFLPSFFSVRSSFCQITYQVSLQKRETSAFLSTEQEQEEEEEDRRVEYAHTRGRHYKQLFFFSLFSSSFSSSLFLLSPRDAERNLLLANSKEMCEKERKSVIKEDQRGETKRHSHTQIYTKRCLQRERCTQR